MLPILPPRSPHYSGESTGVLKKLGDPGGSNGATDSDGHEKRNVGRIKEEKKQKHQNSCSIEDVGEAPWRQTQVETEGFCAKRHESLEYQGGIGCPQGKNS